MITYMEKLTVERQFSASTFVTLATEIPLTPSTMEEATSLARDIEYLDRQLALYNGKRPLMSRQTKSKV